MKNLTRRKLGQVLNVLAAQGIQVEVSATAGPQDARRLARKAIGGGCDLIVVCGGDGTINEVACGMTGSLVPLLVIPGGTANVLARELQLPGSFSQCAALAKKGVVRRISVGRAGERRFLLMAGIGVDAGIVAASSPWLKRRLGEGAYWVAGFQQWARYHFKPFELLIRGERFRGTFAVISRSRNYAASFRLTPEASLFSHHFEVCLFESLSRLRYLYYLQRATFRRHLSLPDVKMLKARTIDVIGSEDTLVQVDGELTGGLPQNFTLEEKALSLVVPRQRLTDL
jgi:YegS/Rv2252/BmrU family lipid kinase